MIRKIIRIDEEKCNGCGLCVSACHEGAIELIDGKAKLTKENYCDGLGDCLPACPMQAISFEQREAPAYDEKAVLQAKREKSKKHGSCLGSRPALLNNIQAPSTASQKSVSRLMQWPCQLKLVPIHAPYFDNAKLLIAADCTAYAYADFHQDFMQGKITLIGCPKLDSCDYAEKLAQIFTYNSIQSIQVLRMEVPCCGGLENAVKRAILASGKKIPLQVVTVSTNGKIL
ncbi:MAG: 4Fe-4S binding protein [Clostridia bacterium]|nr:4Fe-4S binding protein [Clostridia bacterium]